jgi:hypothetical protein
MGGNALRNCTTRRYNKDEYQDICTDVTNRLTFLFSPKAQPTVIPAYRMKESFGDLDVLIRSNVLPQDYQRRIEILFKPKEIVKNGNCLSFEYKEFQIDLITTPYENFETSLNYFAWNDLGNLCGRLSHLMGLRLGHDGLAYRWRIGETQHFKTVIVETDWAKILHVLGLSYERYTQGFDTLEDIFEFVVSSPYFNKDIFLLHNRNHTSRTRDRKRKTYMEFLKWVEDYKQTTEQNFWQEWRKGEVSKACWLPKLFREMPHFEKLYNEVQAEWEEAVEYKRRFNGDLVMQWTGLKDKELGKFMQYMRTHLGDENMKRDILKMNEVLVERYVKYFHDKYTGNLPKMDVNVLDLEAHRVKSKDSVKGEK